MGTLRKKCKTYGCSNLHRNISGYCDECTARYRAKHPMPGKGEGDTGGGGWQRPVESARKEFGSQKWRKFAKDFLALHPTCEICGAPATSCDHKDIPADVMIDMWGAFDYDPSHYQALCHSCNARKGASYDRQIRRKYRKDLETMANMMGEVK